MSRHSPLLRCLLLLMLVAGPLQAQTILLCEMMELPRQETCCCHDIETAREAEADTDCNRPSCHASPRAEGGECCEQAVEVSYEPDAGPPIAKPSTDHTDLSLPMPLLIVYELQPPPLALARAFVPRPTSVAAPPGTHLYLRTERLRI